MLEKALHEPGLQNDAALSRIHKMKARIELIGELPDLKQLKDLLAKLSSQ